MSIKTFLQDKIQKHFMPPQLTREVITNNIKRAYEAAKSSDQFKHIPQSLSPNSATQTATEKMRDQARYLDENHDLTISVLDTLVAKVVGKRIRITPTVKTLAGELDEEVNGQIKEIWRNFEKSPEVTNQHNMGGCDRLMCRTWLRDGEVLQRFISGNVPGLTHGSVVPLSIEMIEPDYLPFSKNEETGNTKTIQGIQLTEWGAPTHYHLLKQSPYEIYPAITGQGMGLETFSINAIDIRHLKFTRRISQIRGVSILHGVIRRLESIMDYEQSEQVAARVAAAFTGYIKKDMESGDGTAADEDRGFEMHPGMIFDNLMPGEDVGIISSDRPNTGLLDFRNAMLRAVAGGTMTHFSAISGYYDGTYSSQRQELVESASNYDILRDTYISCIKQPTYNKFMEMALMFGHISMGPTTDILTIFDTEINGIPTTWIDPKKEMEGFTLAKDAKFLSRGMIIRSMGNDPDEVGAEIDKEIEAEPEMDILENGEDEQEGDGDPQDDNDQNDKEDDGDPQDDNDQNDKEKDNEDE